MSDWSGPTTWAVLAIIAFNGVFTVWVLVGGWFDMVAFFRALQQQRVDPTDDGRAVIPEGDRAVPR
jgi:hypothetical protein